MIRPVRELEQPIPPATHGVFWLRANGTPGTTVVEGVRLSTPQFSRAVAPNLETRRGPLVTPPQPQLVLLPALANTGQRYVLDVASVAGLNVSIVNRWSSEFHHDTTLATGTYVLPAGVDSGFGEPRRWAKAFVKEPFTLPAAGETVEVTVTSTDWMVAGRTVAFWGLADCSGEIDSITDGETFVFRFNGSYGDGVEGDEIPAATSLGPWTPFANDFTMPATVYATLSPEVASSDWFAVGDEVLCQSSPGAGGSGITNNGYYRVSAIADGTHLTLMQGLWPHPATIVTRNFPSVSHCFLARARHRTPGPHDLPYTHVTANLTSLPAVGDELTLEVAATAWMEVGMLLCAFGRFPVSGEITAIDDATHVTIERNNEAIFTITGDADGFWGAIVCPYTRTTADLTFPVVNEETTIAVGDASWIAAVEVPAVTTKPVWLGRPLQEAQAIPCFKIGGRWIAAKAPLIGGVLWRLDGETGRVKWKSDWSPGSIDGSVHTGITSLASDGERIYAGGHRGTEDGDELFTVRCYNGKGAVLWQADLGTTAASVSLIEGVGLLVGHSLHTVSGASYLFTLLDPETGDVIWRANPAGTHTTGVGGGVAVLYDDDIWAAYTYSSLSRLVQLDTDGNVLSTMAAPVTATYLAATPTYLFISGSAAARFDGAATTLLSVAYSGSITTEDETVWISQSADKVQLDAVALTLVNTLPTASGDLAVMNDGGYVCGAKRFEADLDLLWFSTLEHSGMRACAHGDDVLLSYPLRVSEEGQTWPL